MTPRTAQRWLGDLFRVHEYADVFERLVRLPLVADMLPRFVRGTKCQAVFERNAIFIHIPKNAGTSIVVSLYGGWVGHKTALFYKKSAAEFFGRVRKFAVLRDPVERFMSSYWFMRQGGGSDIRMEPKAVERLQQITSVDLLLEYLESNKERIFEIDPLFRSQYWYLSDSDGKLLIDELYILGEDDAHIDRALSEMGATKLVALNRTRRGAGTITTAQKRRVESLYAEDVQLLGAVRKSRSR